MFLYAAYGSNLNVEQMEYRCPNAIPVCKGKIENWKPFFAYHMDIRESEGDYTPVGVWLVDEEDLENLRLYEGYYGDYYKEVNLPIVCESGEIVTAIVYVMGSSKSHGYMPPSQSYFDTCLVGYHNFDFTDDEIANLFNIAYKYDSVN